MNNTTTTARPVEVRLAKNFQKQIDSNRNVVAGIKEMLLISSARGMESLHYRLVKELEEFINDTNELIKTARFAGVGHLIVTQEVK